MGIYIKNLRKPESCVVCFFRPCGTNYCELLDRNYVDIDKDCPLLEIKTPHGRLIDADTLIARLEEMKRFKIMTLDSMIATVKEQPVLVDKEEPWEDG